MYKSGGGAIATHADWKKYAKKKAKKYVKKAGSDKVVKAPGAYLKRKYDEYVPSMPVTASSSSHNKTVIKYTSPRGFVGPKEEWKAVDTVGEVIIQPGGDVVPLNMMAEGTGISQRVGRQITVKCIEIRAWIEWIAGGDAQAIKFAVVYDRSPNGVAAHFGDIFQPLAGVITNKSLPCYMQNLSNRGRFDILWDNLHSTAPGSLAATHTSPPPVFELKIDCTLGTVYMSTGGTMGSMQAGAVYFVFADSTLPADPPEHSLNLTARVRYTDA